MVLESDKGEHVAVAERRESNNYPRNQSANQGIKGSEKSVRGALMKCLYVTRKIWMTDVSHALRYHTDKASA